jgi:hypothetical protein
MTLNHMWIFNWASYYSSHGLNIGNIHLNKINKHLHGCPLDLHVDLVDNIFLKQFIDF